MYGKKKINKKKNLAYKQLIIGLNILVQTGSHTGSDTEK